MIEVNLNAVFRLCQAAGGHMLAQGRGKIINIASLLSFQGGIFGAVLRGRQRGGGAIDQGAGQRMGGARASR